MLLWPRNNIVKGDAYEKEEYQLKQKQTMEHNSSGENIHFPRIHLHAIPILSCLRPCFISNLVWFQANGAIAFNITQTA